jgi:hypothetical protein
MFLDCVIGRRGIAIQHPSFSLAKNHYLEASHCCFGMTPRERKGHGRQEKETKVGYA